MLLGGSFQLNNTGAPTVNRGDGTPARTDVGTYTITLDKKYPEIESIVAHVNAGVGDQKIGNLTWANTSGVTVITATIVDISGGAVADLNAVRLNWQAIANGRAA